VFHFETRGSTYGLIKRYLFFLNKELQFTRYNKQTNTGCVKDLDKVNLVKPAYGGLVLDSSQF